MTKFVLGNHKCNINTMEKKPGSDVLSHTLRAVDATPTEYGPMFRLAVLLHDVGKRKTRTVGDDNEFHFYGHEKVGAEDAANICNRMKLSKKQTQFVVALVREHMFMMDERTTKGAVKRLMQRLPEGCTAKDVARMRISDKMGNMFFRNNSAHKLIGVARFIELANEIEEDESALKVTDLNINGHDLMDMGFEPGPIFSEILNFCLAEVIEERIENTRESLIAFINEMYTFHNEMYPVMVVEEKNDEV